MNIISLIWILLVFSLTDAEEACSSEEDLVKCMSASCSLKTVSWWFYSEDSIVCFKDGIRYRYVYKTTAPRNIFCIPKAWNHPRRFDCNELSPGGYTNLEIPGDKFKLIGDQSLITSINRLTQWLLRNKNNATMTEKRGSQLHRTSAALYLANTSIFTAGSSTGEEITSEIALQLLSKIAQRENIRSWEIALYINALLISCKNPRDFYGRNLVLELREKVEQSKHPTLIEMIALCNSKDQMSQADVVRILSSCNCKNHPSCTDSTALAIMALSCLKDLPNIAVESEIIQKMTLSLKEQQYANGTVVDTRTTALVVQALVAAQDYGHPFNLEAALKIILDQQNADGSYKTFLDAYYILPALSLNSLIKINNSHCQGLEKSETNSNKDILLKNEYFNANCSIFIIDDLDAKWSWTFKVPQSSSFYDVIELLNKSLDSKYRVKYNVLNGKPYIHEVFHIQSDPEAGSYWFTYRRIGGSSAQPQLIDESPADVKIKENDEFILWYKSKECNEDTRTYQQEFGTIVAPIWYPSWQTSWPRS